MAIDMNVFHGFAEQIGMLPQMAQPTDCPTTCAGSAGRSSVGCQSPWFRAGWKTESTRPPRWALLTAIEAKSLPS